MALSITPFKTKHFNLFQIIVAFLPLFFFFFNFPLPNLTILKILWAWQLK